jgi:hypothetical protein
MQSFPASRQFLPFRSKYSPQHPVLKHPQSMLFPQNLKYELLPKGRVLIFVWSSSVFVNWTRILQEPCRWQICSIIKCHRAPISVPFDVNKSIQVVEICASYLLCRECLKHLLMKPAEWLSSLIVWNYKPKLEHPSS